MGLSGLYLYLFVSCLISKEGGKICKITLINPETVTRFRTWFTRP